MPDDRRASGNGLPVGIGDAHGETALHGHRRGEVIGHFRSDDQFAFAGQRAFVGEFRGASVIDFAKLKLAPARR